MLGNKLFLCISGFAMLCGFIGVVTPDSFADLAYDGFFASLNAGFVGLWIHLILEEKNNAKQSQEAV